MVYRMFIVQQDNDEYRITLITPVLMELGDNEAHIFQIPIPEELSSVGEDYDILMRLLCLMLQIPVEHDAILKGTYLHG